jgi:tRNA (uracil-5-)-methyltransferase
MTVDAQPPGKRPCPNGGDDQVIAPPPSKLAKAADGAVPGAAAGGDKPSAATPPQPTQPPRRPSLAAILIPVPARWDDRSLRHWLDSAGVRARSARKKRGATLAFLTFGSTAERVRADAAVAAARPPPGIQGKRPPSLRDDARRTITPAADVDVRDVVAPLWKLPYASQLARKWGKVRDTLSRLVVEKSGGDPAWAAALTPVGILRSPATRGYRNKCEFSVGAAAVKEEDDGGGGTDLPPPPPPPAVGFCLGAFKDGIVEVGPPGPAPNVSPTAAAAADAMAAFLAGKKDGNEKGSALPAWDKVAGRGFWRLLTLREARAATPLPAPAPGSGPAGLLEEGLDDQGAACPPFARLEWERWLVPAGALPAAAADDAPSPPPAGETPTSPPPPPLPPPEEVMLVIQVDPTAAPPDSARAELAALGSVLEAAVRGVAVASGRPPPTTSVWVQHHSGPSNAASDDAPLMRLADAVSGGAGGGGPASNSAGDGCLTDTLAGLRFRVSPSAFFQVNTPAAALLYRAAVAWADPRPGDVVLDVCCGTGTLGVCAARVVADGGGGGGGGGGTTATATNTDEASPAVAQPPPPRVLGVDIIPSAIADAAANAAANGLDPAACTFVAGKAEDALAGLLLKATERDSHSAHDAPGAPPSNNLIAIVDPPRAGLHPKVCAALRGCAALKRIVYVSCNVESQAADAARLCGGGGGGGKGGGGGGGQEPPPPPFKPVRCLAVDLFPHTAHVESVLLLER